MAAQPHILGIGGTVSPDSTSERALRVALNATEMLGASVHLFKGASLAALPYYSYTAARDSSTAAELVAEIRKADGLIIASPGYHGSVSGLIKNAIDYIEETAKDSRTYLDGVPVGLIVTASGWQATGSTLSTLRSVVHALRGWPTPLGGAIKSEPKLFEGGVCTNQSVSAQLELIGRQVYEFSNLQKRISEPLV